MVAIIENNPERLELAKKEYPGTRLFENYHDFLAEKIGADIVAVAAQDEDHKEHAIAIMQAGYDLLLEKPIANNAWYYEIADRAGEYYLYLGGGNSSFGGWAKTLERGESYRSLGMKAGLWIEPEIIGKIAWK